jgi:hypothetical protein
MSNLVTDQKIWSSAVARALLLWVILIGLRLYDKWGYVTTGINIDPDSLMRLIEVRDWLGGQSWFDLQQYRIGPDGGVAMHWSRIGDLLPALCIIAFKPWLGLAKAEWFAQIIIPLLLLLPVIWLILAIARNLAGRAADLPAMVVVLMSQGMLTLYGPGSIDHHNLQLLAVLVLLWACTGVRGWRSGLIAGTAICFSLVIGIETAPHIAAVLLATTVLWILSPAEEADFLRGLGAGLLFGAGLLMLLFMPRPWTGSYCDSWTLPLFWLVAGSGALFLIAGQLYRNVQTTNGLPITGRGLAILVPGLLLLTAVLWAYPACRQHPGGNDPILWTYWMNEITENKSIWSIMRDESFAQGYIYLAAAPTCIVAALWLMARHGHQYRHWLAPVAATSAALAITLLHVRGQALLAGCSAGLAAALIAEMRQYKDIRRTLGWLLFMPYSYMVLCFYLGQLSNKAEEQSYTVNYCQAEEVLTRLKTLPKSRFIIPLMAEAPVLAATEHTSLGATYHRNVVGNHTMLTLMLAEPSTARQQLKLNKVDYILYCPGYSIDTIARDKADSFAATLKQAAPPAWLPAVAHFAHHVVLYRVTTETRRESRQK